jgi:hypothetical protein
VCWITACSSEDDLVPNSEHQQSKDLVNRWGADHHNLVGQTEHACHGRVQKAGAAKPALTQ